MQHYLLVSSQQLLPSEPGVYLFLDQKGSVLYVGKARDLKKRIASYFTRDQNLGDKTKALVANAHAIRFIVVESELESLLLEAEYIKKYDPKYNSMMTDGKRYPMIQITTKSEYPAILTARKPEDKKSIYFGPYPSSANMRYVLRMIRRIFPYQSVRNHPKQVCLYHHLGLCPCPPVFDSPEFKKEYRKTIRRIIKFLEGKKRDVLKDLEKERDSFSSMEDFESAKKIQKQIDAILYVTNPFHKPFEYDTNPNLRRDLRDKELFGLQSELKKHGVLVKNLKRIECYDISNLQGTSAVGSMVVFIDGERDTSLYRRFKIRKVNGPNDFEMMEEVIRRRLKHDEWDMPNLLIVDGGKGQISSALKVVKESQLNIPIIGLAKREEIIITSDFKEIRLPRDSESLHLIQRIRDEAHRFAIAYHKILRSKSFFSESS